MSSLSKSSSSSEDEAINHDQELRRGPWTLEEDSLLIHSIALHGEGRWNLLAKRAVLRRTGKSCRLRWLNYLKPDVKRGNLTPQEQLLILDLHSKLGNRWSKIAQHLPGRTDNEIKNYWRTRVQKQARHLKVDANSTAFQEIVKCFWMPRLLQKMECSTVPQSVNHVADHNSPPPPPLPPPPRQDVSGQAKLEGIHNLDAHEHNSDSEYGSSSCNSSAESMNISQIPQLTEYTTSPFHAMGDSNNSGFGVRDFYYDNNSYYDMETVNLSNLPTHGGFENPVRVPETDWFGCDFADNYMWNMEDFMAT